MSHGKNYRNARAAFDRAIATPPQLGIHDYRGRNHGGRRRGLAGAAPARGGQGRIALEPRTVTGQQQPDAIPAFGQQAGGDEAIASVIAGPCHDGDARTRGVPRRDGVGDCLPGIFHQRDAGNAGRDRQAVRLCHLGGGEQLDHGRRLPCQSPGDIPSIPLPAAGDRCS